MEAAFGGGFVKARAELGVTAFGLQVIQLPPNYSDYPEHDHAESGQEEVFLALGGSGWMDIEGERVELDSETFVRVARGAQAQGLRGTRGPAHARDRRLPRRGLQDPGDDRTRPPPTTRAARPARGARCAQRAKRGCRASRRSAAAAISRAQACTSSSWTSSTGECM